MYRNIPTHDPDTMVHTTSHIAPDGTVTLRGYAVNAHTGIRLDGSTTKKRKAQSEAAIPAVQQRLVSVVMSSLVKATAEEKRGRTKREIAADHPLSQAFAELKKAPDTLKARWNDAVRRRWLEYFDRNILPVLVALMLQGGIAEGEDLHDSLSGPLLEDVRKNGRSKGNSRVARDTVDGNLAAAQVIYDACRRIDPTLPAVRLARPRRIRYQPEQCKSLPREVRRRLARELRARVRTEPLYVVAAVLMWDAGARTAEAAAVIPEVDIIADSDGQTNILYVLYQEKEGTRCPILKTDNAYRCVPLSYWGVCMIRECLQHINPEQYADKARAPIRVRDLSKWVAGILNRCGLGAAFIQMASDDEARYPDKDIDGKPIYDVGAYILRRDRASRWRNVCGLTSAECDYLLGHADKRAKKKKVDYTLRAEQRKLAKKLERYVYDEEMSAHPAIRPIGVEHGLDYDFIPFEWYAIENETDKAMIIKLDLFAAENAEDITLLLGSGAEIHGARCRSVKNHGRRSDVPIIGANQIKGSEEDG